MSKKIIFGLLIFVTTFLAMYVAWKGYSLKHIEKRIWKNEKELQKVDSVRTINNSTPIPFRRDQRDSVLRSVNAKTGFRLYMRNGKGN